MHEIILFVKKLSLRISDNINIELQQIYTITRILSHMIIAKEYFNRELT